MLTAHQANCVLFQNSTATPSADFTKETLRATSTAPNGKNQTSHGLTHASSRTTATNASTTAPPITLCKDFQPENIDFGGHAQGATLCQNCPQSNGTWLQEIPLNTCSVCTTAKNGHDFGWLWTSSCTVTVGTVSLIYWPTGTPNVTDPSTYYDPVQDFTYTSPSVYFRVDTIHASNACGGLGPTVSNGIFAFDLAEVSTMIPHRSNGISTQSVRQLFLSDLEVNCPSTEPTAEEASAYLKNDVNRCNPRLVWPMNMKRFGYPYWKSCMAYHAHLGVYDPPHAITQAAAAAAVTIPSAKTTDTIPMSAPASVASITPQLAKETGSTGNQQEFEKASLAAPPKASSVQEPSQQPPQPATNEAEVTKSAEDDIGVTTGIADWIANVISAVKTISKSHTAFDLEATSSPRAILPVLATVEDQAPFPAASNNAVSSMNSAGNEAQAIDSTGLGDPASRLEAGPTKTAWVKPEDVVPTWTTALEKAQNVASTGGAAKVDSGESESGNLLASSVPTAAGVAAFTANDEKVFTASRGGNNVMLFGASTTAAFPVGSSIAFEGVELSAGIDDLVVNGDPIIHMAKATQPVETVLTFSDGHSVTAISTADKDVLEGSSYTTTLPLQNVAGYGEDKIGNQEHQSLTWSRSNRDRASSSKTAQVAIITGSNGAAFTVVSGAEGFALRDGSTEIPLQHGKKATLDGVAISMQSKDVMIGTSTVVFPSRSDKEAVTIPTLAINGAIKENAETSEANSTRGMSNNSAYETSVGVQDPTSEARETVATSKGSRLKGLNMLTCAFVTLTGVVLPQKFCVVRCLS